jgi:hypothetical protein
VSEPEMTRCPVISDSQVMVMESSVFWFLLGLSFDVESGVDMLLQKLVDFQQTT